MKKIRYMVVMLVLTIISVCGCGKETEIKTDQQENKKEETSAVKQLTAEEEKRSQYWTPVYKDGKFVIINLNNEVIAEIENQDIYGTEFGFQKDGVAKVYNDHTLWGYVNKNGKMVVPCEYNNNMTFDDLENSLGVEGIQNLPVYSDGIISVIQEGKQKYLNADGKEVDQDVDIFNYRYKGEEGEVFDGLILVEKDSKCGFLNSEGKEVIPCIYDDIDYEKSKEGLVKVCKDWKYGYINAEGEEVIPCIHDKDTASEFSEGMAAVERGMPQKWGYVDKEGKMAIPWIYDEVREFSEEMAAVRKGEKWGYIDKNGEEIIPFIYDYANEFSEGLAGVVYEGKYGYINQQGEEIVPFVYAYEYNHLSYMYPFMEGLAQVIKEDGSCGYIDKNGNEVIPFIYNYPYMDSDKEGFLNGVSLVWKEGKFGAIDKSGTEVIPCIYEYIYRKRGFIEAERNNQKGYYSEVGKELVPCMYDRIDYKSEKELFIAEKEGKTDVYDKNGAKLVDWQGKFKSYIDDDYIEVYDPKGFLGVIDWEGNVVLEPQYCNYHWFRYSEE